MRLARRDAPAQATAVVAAAGSFAAISTLLGSPLLGAFLLMETSGLGGPTLGLVLVPGLVAAGIGSLIFIGLDNWTGLGTFSLALPDLPSFGHPNIGQFGWALVIGLVAAVVGTGIYRLALALRPHVERRMLLATPLVGLTVGGLAVTYATVSGHDVSDVLFSGQDAMGPLIANSADYSVAALVLLVACKGLAYAQAAADLGAAGHPAAGIGWAGRDAAGDRARRGGLRGLGQAHPGPRSRHRPGNGRSRRGAGPTLPNTGAVTSPRGVRATSR